MELNFFQKMVNLKPIKHKKSNRKKINFWNKSKLLKKFTPYLSHGNLISFIWKNQMEVSQLLTKNGFLFHKKSCFKVSKITPRKKLPSLPKISNQQIIRAILDKSMARMQIATSLTIYIKSSCFKKEKKVQ